MATKSARVKWVERQAQDAERAAAISREAAYEAMYAGRADDYRAALTVAARHEARAKSLKGTT